MGDSLYFVFVLLVVWSSQRQKSSFVNKRWEKGCRKNKGSLGWWIKIEGVGVVNINLRQQQGNNIITFDNVVSLMIFKTNHKDNTGYQDERIKLCKANYFSEIGWKRAQKVRIYSIVWFLRGLIVQNIWDDKEKCKKK